MFSDLFVFSRKMNFIVILTQPQLTYINIKSATRDILGTGVSCSPEKTFEYSKKKSLLITSIWLQQTLREAHCGVDIHFR